MNDQELNQLYDSIVDQLSPQRPQPTRAKKILDVMKKFLKAFPTYFGLYLGLAGLFFFNLFILEEAQQQVVFSSWNAKSAQEWRLIKDTIPLLENINKTSSTINKYFGWINPIGYLAYDSYNQAEIAQINSLKALVFAEAPELFHGEIVSFSFTPMEIQPEKEFYRFVNGRISILSSYDYIPKIVSGTVIVKDEQIVVDIRQK